MATLDPELVRQMVASEKDSLLEAVVRLRPTLGMAASAPDETERMAKDLVDRVQKATGERQEAVNVFRNLGSFAISAKPAFLKALISQPEVVAAVANNQAASGVIPPAEKRRVRVEEVSRDSETATKRAAKRRPRRPRV